MAQVTLDGISTRYEIVGEGSPIIMFSPGGFDATIEKWSTQGHYAKFKPVDNLSKRHQLIMFDRRECGQSGGRVERLTFAHYVRQAIALMDHLKIEKAHMMGGCMGCSPVAAMGVMHPDRVSSLVLFWPVGGAKYRLSSQQRFAEHLAFVHQNGMQAVVDLVKKDGKAFGADPRGGPWASVIKSDADFAAHYAQMNVDDYKLIIAGWARTMFDRDTAPGAEPEDLLRCKLPALVVPGNDAFHATSAARYLHECLTHSQYWDVSVAEQTEEATAKRMLEFLGACEA